MDKDIENSFSDDEQEAITKDEAKEDMDRDGISSLKRKRQDSSHADLNSDENEIARKIRKVSSEDISAASEENKNRLAKEQEEKSTISASIQDILTSEPQDNSTVKEGGEQMVTSECEDNSKIPDRGQEILTSEHEDNASVSERGQGILTFENGEKFNAQEMGKEILTSVLEDISTAKESNQTCLTLENEDNVTVPECDQEMLTSKHENESNEPESCKNNLKSQSENKSNAPESSEAYLVTVHEDNSTASEIGQEVLKSEYEDKSKVLENGQEHLISVREDDAPIKDIIQEISLSEHDGNETVSENVEEISSSEYENKSSVTECGQEMLKSEETDSESEQDCENIPAVSISERDVLQRFVEEVERAWKVVNTLTGFKLGIVPPVCLCQGKKVGHWINLNMEVIPFVYVRSTDDCVHEINENPLCTDDMNTKTCTAALLITEYVKSVTGQLELEADDNLRHVKEKMNELNTFLESFTTDINSMVLSSNAPDLLLAMSKIKDLALIVDQLSLTETVVWNKSKNSMLTVTESHLLCSILGLDPKFVQKLLEINDNRVLHKSPFYIVENLIEEEMKEMVMDSWNISEDNITLDLLMTCFSKGRSQEIVKRMKSQNDTTHSPIYLVQDYLEHFFSTHPLLEMMTFLDRYADKPRDEWFDAEAYLRAACSNNTVRIHFQMIKLGSFYRDRLVTSESVNNKFEKDRHKLLFHGAKQANALDGFLRKGIMLNLGGRYHDFSHGNGFYLSNGYGAAAKWALKRKERPSAVIVYRVPDSLLVFGYTAGLDLSVNRDLWSRVVKHHRTGCPNEDMADTSQRSFIKGAVCRNGRSILSGKSTTPIPLEDDGAEIQQYCIRSEQFAAEFSSLVVAVVIFY
ncbi:unnamed protein product [Lymnaea stagnalis]|uniref:PARP n=1 Tax=Lymnaea stagnalis TaxID=6523 RepID=A0AAV2H3I9_LYMST